MSTQVHVGQDSAMEILATKAEAHDDGHANHPPFLAHHFDTPEQQYMTGKIGMWIFLGTEILMFGGLFCAYGVLRYNYPEVFLYAANEYLSTTWGAINTIVLLASSLTMAMAVRYAQLDKQKALVTCLLLTLLGGAGFMCIKGVEYRDKYHHYVGVGAASNAYSKSYEGPHKKLTDGQEAAGATAPGAPAVEGAPTAESAAPTGAETQDPQAPAPPSEATAAAADPRTITPRPNPHAGTGDDPAIKPQYLAPAGLVAPQLDPAAHHAGLDIMPQRSREHIFSFFQIYFLMTGLHGIHVIIGMGLIFWVTLRASAPRRRPAMLGLVPFAVGAYIIFVGYITHSTAPFIVGGVLVALGLGVGALGMALGRKRPAMATGEFSSAYFTPVDLVGLYWHLVDLIWIFLFPLLYLIH